jgi:hypothetical protein
MTDRKILFFDIDGTILTDDGKRIIPDSTRLAIKRARENGHLTFVNTGRVFVNIEDNIRNIGFDGYVCGCGTYIRAGKEVLFHNEISKKRCREIAHMCRDFGMGAIFEHTEHTGYDGELAENGNSEILEYFKSMNRKLIDDIDSDEFVFDKFSAWYTKESKLEEFKNGISADFNYIQREGSFCEIIPKGFSKATGIEFLLKAYDIPLENSYAFGDSNNDLDMLSYVPNSIAMGVCTPEIEAVSSYKTDTVLGDGIYKAMEHFGII